MVPVFYHEDLEKCKEVIKACYDGGLKVFEYTNRGEKATVNFPILKKYVAENCDGLMLGIGSIYTKEQAEKFINLNPDFIVSPIFDKEIAACCKAHEIYWIPGCATLSEIAAAEKSGADIIKIFPSNILGPGFVKAVRGPMPHLKLMPTGGVSPTLENLKSWFESGVVCVGIGSQLLTKERLKNIDLLKIEVKNTLDIIAGVRNQKG